MKFDFNVEQNMLRDSARRFFAKETSGDLIRELIQDENGHHDKIWQQMAKLGWMGLLIPESCGGEEMSAIDMAILLHEMGYACFPGPFFSTAVIGTMMLMETGNETQKKAILPKVALGRHLLALALNEDGQANNTDRILTRAERQGGDYILTGKKRLVPDAQIADSILCVAQADESEDQGRFNVFLVNPKSENVNIKPLTTFTGEKLFDIDFNKVRVPDSNRLGDSSFSKADIDRVLLKAAVGKCAEMVGQAQCVMDMTVEHAKSRIQFGRPVSSFQAVQHHCANMLIYLETARFMMYQAAWQISEGLPFEKAASMSKSWVSDSCRHLVALGHQIMGGLGFMEEMDLHLYFNRVKAGELAFGNADFHREMVAVQLER